jgi:hypothetical protein
MKVLPHLQVTYNQPTLTMASYEGKELQSQAEVKDI